LRRPSRAPRHSLRLGKEEKMSTSGIKERQREDGTGVRLANVETAWKLTFILLVFCRRGRAVGVPGRGFVGFGGEGAGEGAAEVEVQAGLFVAISGFDRSSPALYERGNV
jgi:hypothetical protein